MVYHKTTKKYSHCQYYSALAGNRHGFFTLELVYVMLIVTSFMLVITCYMARSVYWQRHADRSLQAMTIARNVVEKSWMDRTITSGQSRYQEDIYTIDIVAEKQVNLFQILKGQKNVPGHVIRVSVSWNDEYKQRNTIRLQGYL